MERNPLEILASDVKSVRNKRGRPVKADAIKFSRPQPKSAIIAQFLKEKSFINKSSKRTSKPKPWQITESVDTQRYLVHDDDDTFSSVKQEIVKVVRQSKIKFEVSDYESCPKRVKRKAKKANSDDKYLKVPKDEQEKRFACDFPNCSYAAKLSCNLVKHKRIHTSEKPYICDQCAFRTNFINSLKVHRRIHTAEKPYSCEHCGYRCNTSSNLKKHKMHRHPEVGKI